MLVTFASYELGASGPGVLFVGLKTAEFQGFPIVLECWCWDWESTFDAAVDRSVAIIHYLDDTLDRQYPISAQLTRLYEYFCYELSRVKSGRNKTELERVKRMAGELRESFRTAEKSSSAR